MKRIVRSIDRAEARELLQQPHRACLAYAGDDGPHADPVTVLFEDGRYLVATDSARRPAVDQEVVLLVDTGCQFFDLRAVYVRGRVEVLTEPAGLPDGSSWVHVQPTRTVAWDYGQLRQADG